MDAHVITGIPDFQGLALMEAWPQAAPSPSEEGGGTPMALLRVGLLVGERRQHSVLRFLREDMVGRPIGVDGVLFYVHRAESVEVTEGEMEEAGGVALEGRVCVLHCVVNMHRMVGTVFEALGRQTSERRVNVELLGAGIPWRVSELSGEALHGKGGGGAGNPRDSHSPVASALLTLDEETVDASGLYHLELGPSMVELLRATRRHIQVRETVFVNGLAGTVVACDATEDAITVLIPPAISERSSLAFMRGGADGTLVNVEFEDASAADAKLAAVDTQSLRDEHYMELAMQAGDRGRMRSGRRRPWAGALLVDDMSGIVLGRGYHYAASGPCAERVCFEDAVRGWSERFAAAPQYPTTLYLTVEPSATARSLPNEPDSPSPAEIVAAMPSVRRIVLGALLPSHSTLDEAAESMGVAHLSRPAVALIDQQSQVAAELRWSLREYFHLVDTGTPYTLFFMTQTLDGRQVSRDTLQNERDAAALDKLVDTLRLTAHAVITDDYTLVRNSAVFEGLVADEDAGIRHVYYTKDMKPTQGVSAKRLKRMAAAQQEQGDHGKQIAFLPQVLPARIVLSGLLLLGLRADQRTLLMPYDTTMGSVFLCATRAFIGRDVAAHAHEAEANKGALMPLTGEDGALVMGSLERPDMARLWPNKPHVTLFPALSADEGDLTSPDALRPDPRAVFRYVGDMDIHTAFAEGDGSLLWELARHELVQELVVVVAAQVAGTPTAQSATTPFFGLPLPSTLPVGPWKALEPIAASLVNDSNLIMLHYAIVY